MLQSRECQKDSAQETRVEMWGCLAKGEDLSVCSAWWHRVEDETGSGCIAEDKVTSRVFSNSGRISMSA